MGNLLLTRSSCPKSMKTSVVNIRSTTPTGRGPEKVWKRTTSITADHLPWEFKEVGWQFSWLRKRIKVGGKNSHTKLVQFKLQIFSSGTHCSTDSLGQKSKSQGMPWMIKFRKKGNKLSELRYHLEDSSLRVIRC